jgi:hypothetical protein
MDFVVRYPYSAELENRIESAEEEKTEFSEIKDRSTGLKEPIYQISVQETSSSGNALSRIKKLWSG